MGNISAELCGLAIVLAGFAYAGHAQTRSPNAIANLGGTSWKLVKFLGSNDTTLTPGDQSKYTIAFEPAGGVSVRIDCNRGRGTWNSAGANQLQFGPLGLTRAMCPPAPLNDRLVKDWEHVRSYTLKNGHLFLPLMADGGTYEYEPNAGSSPASAPASSQQSALSALPATFVGTMPCADCPGIRYQLTLNADHTFTSHMTYEERNASFDDHGRWELAGKVLVLHGSHNATDKFSVRDADTLRKLDINGNEIVSPFNNDFKRVPESEPSGSQDATDASIENTHWRLTALGDSPVAADSEQREAFFVLDPKQHRVSGSGGCNRLAGSYELNGDRLKFGQMAGTMMACPQGMDTEQAFLQSLGRVNKGKITGQSLELFDADGKVLAQFTVREN